MNETPISELKIDADIEQAIIAYFQRVSYQLNVTPDQINLHISAKGDPAKIHIEMHNHRVLGGVLVNDIE